MLRRHSMTILPAITFVFILAFAGQSAQAEWNVSFYGEVGGPSYTSYGDRITSDYRRGYQVDDWVERGASSVTESPIYSDGIRLSSWATQYEDDYDYGIASAVYFFEIPRRARSVRIKIAYEGEADRGYLDDDIVGRVWIRRSQPGDDYEEYYPREGRYEDVDKPLYGDTFALRARKRFEIIRISADDYSVDDMMELHVVAEGRQSLDVKYIEVETYSYLPSVRVITRYYRDYTWRPWHNYTYWYFYTGPVYHFSDYYYVRYTYPHYHRHYIDIRKRYNSYLRVYYVKRPREHVRWANVVRVPKGTRRTWNRGHLNRWTSSHEETRRMYSVVKTGKTRSSVDVRKSRTRIRSVLSSHTRSSPAAVRSSSSVRSRGTSSSAQRRASVRTPTSRSTEVKTRQGERSSATPRSRPEVRTGTDRQRRSVSSPTRVETRSSTKTRDSNVRSPVRTRSSSSTQSDRTKSVRQAPTRSSSEEKRETRSTIRSKTRVESSKSKEDERKRSSSVIRTPSRSQSTKKSPPQKKVEVKKDDDDEEDKKKSKSSSTKTSTKSESSSTKKRKVRSR